MKAVEQIQPLPESTWRDNERKFTALTRLIQWGQEGFTLALVDFDLTSLRKETLRRLQEDCQAKELHFVQVELAPPPSDVPKTYDVLDQLQERVAALSPDKPPDALVILSLETLFPKALAADETRITQELVEALQPLNLGRNILAKMFPCPVILCLPPRAMGILVRTAPDIVSWKSAAFSFQSDLDAVRTQIAQAASAPTNWWARWRLRYTDQAVLAEEAAHLEAVIADAEELPADKTTIAKLNLRLGWIAVALDNRLRALTAFDETIKHTDDPRLRKTAFQGQDKAKQLSLGVGVAPERAVGIRKLFRGATALSEADHLLGREEELRRLIAQVTSAGTRFFILWGETGCGKSSLARAGLVPALDKEGRFLPVVVRQWNDPIENIRHALAQAVLDVELPEVDLKAATTLLGCVQRIAAHTKKTVVIVCDQFEQFFTAHPRLSNRQAVIKAIGACYNDFGLPCKFVFVVRTDELGRMAEFDSEVAEPLEQRKRFHLPLFTEEDAVRVLRQLAQQGGLEWSDALIQAFVADLTHEGRVRPVELQLTGAALAVSGISTYRDYEQAERAEGLLRDYVQLTLRDLRQSKADETAMKRILLALVSESNTRLALTFDEISERTGLKESLTRAHFSLIEAHLVSRIDNVDTPAQYELTHDTLIEKVLQLTRTLQDKQRQADRILKRALEDLKNNPRQTIGVRAAYLIREHADRRDLKNPQVQSLRLRSFRWNIFKWIIVPLIGLAIITLYVVQNNYSHLTVESDFGGRIVVRRGLPRLGFLPWIGNKIILDTGFTASDIKTDQRDTVRGIVHKEWGNLSSGILREHDFVYNLLSMNEQGKLLHQTGESILGVEKLLDALASKNKNVRSAAVSTLGEIGQIEAAVLTLEKKEPIDRAPLITQLLLGALRYGELDVRLRAASSLVQITRANPSYVERTVAPLRDALKDEDSTVRAAAVSALVQIGRPVETLKPLLDMLKDNNLTVRAEAASALRAVAQADKSLAPQILPPLLTAFKDGDVRGNQALAFKRVAQAAPVQILPFLLTALKDRNRDFNVRAEAASALRAVAQADKSLAPQILPPLLAALKDKDVFVKEEAAFALGAVAEADKSLAPQILPPLLTALKYKLYTPVQVSAAAALGEVAQADKSLAPQILPFLLTAFKDGDNDVQVTAAFALGEVAQADKSLAPQILPSLLPALKYRGEGNVRVQAAFALGRIAQTDKSLAPQIVPPLLAALKDWGVHLTVAIVLGQVAQVSLQAKESAFQSLIDGELNEHESVRLGLAESLSDLFVADALAEAKNGRKPLEFLFAHLEGRQSYLPNGNANTHAVYRNLLVTAMAKWLVKPETKDTHAALRQRLEDMRASDKGLHLRIAAWNALAQAAELKAKEE